MMCQAWHERRVKMASQMSLSGLLLIEMVEVTNKMQVLPFRRRQNAQEQGERQCEGRLQGARLLAPKNAPLLNSVASVSNAGEAWLRQGRSNNLLLLVGEMAGMRLLLQVFAVPSYNDDHR